MIEKIWNKISSKRVIAVMSLIVTIVALFNKPKWIEGIREERVEKSKDEIIQSVKELIYDEAKLEVYEIKNLIAAKEIEMQEEFPYSITQILIMANDSFMQDKYLAIEKRRSFTKELEELIIECSAPVEQVELPREKFDNTIIPMLVIFIFIFTYGAFIGIYVLIYRLRYNKKINQKNHVEIKLKQINTETKDELIPTDNELTVAFSLKKNSNISIVDKSVAGTPTVFISYSWDSQSHIDWVLNLANTLVNNGVDVLLDQYDLGPGKNMIVFMEKSISKADKVLIIFTPNYKLKSEKRKGGVGFEYSILNSELYHTIESNNKFIPILREGTPEDAIPGFMQQFIAVNMTSGLTEGKARELLMAIFDLPQNEKPKLGQRPSF